MNKNFKKYFLLSILVSFSIASPITNIQADHAANAQCNSSDTVESCESKIVQWCFDNVTAADRVACNNDLTSHLDSVGVSEITETDSYVNVCNATDTSASCESKIVQWCYDNRIPEDRVACNDELNGYFNTGSGVGTAQSGQGGGGGGGPGSSLFDISYDNPLRVNSIADFITAILNVAVIIAVPIITLFIIYAGFLYVTARGNAEQIRTATTALTYAIIGGVLVIGAVAITAIIGNVINQF